MAWHAARPTAASVASSGCSGAYVWGQYLARGKFDRTRGMPVCGSGVPGLSRRTRKTIAS